MAALASGLCKYLNVGNFERLVPLLVQQSVIINGSRNNHFFKHLAKQNEHNATDYEYEVSKDPKDWEYVERLLPYETVPYIKEKPVYPSGWSPPTDEAGSHSYYVERSRNHMLSVYLNTMGKHKVKCTRIKRINGDIWKLHDELKAHIENQIGKKVASFVQEGNGYVNFRGDFVYVVEQWMLSKGF